MQTLDRRDPTSTLRGPHASFTVERHLAALHVPSLPSASFIYSLTIASVYTTYSDFNHSDSSLLLLTLNIPAPHSRALFLGNTLSLPSIAGWNISWPSWLLIDIRVCPSAVTCSQRFDSCEPVLLPQHRVWLRLKAEVYKVYAYTCDRSIKFRSIQQNSGGLFLGPMTAKASGF